MKDEKQTFAFFRGCLVPVKLPHLEAVARKVLPMLGIELVDLDFFCCPTNAVRDIDEFQWLVFAARNLALAEEKGLNVLSICNECAKTLIEANHIFKANPQVLEKVNAELKRIGKSYSGNVEVKHFLMVLYDMKDKIRENVKKPLLGLKVASQTGCHILRPSEIIQFDNPERPEKLDEMVSWLGARPFDYDLKSLCCGQAFLPIDKDACFKVMKDKLEQIKDADCLTTGCPACFQQFDLRQRMANLGFDKPVLFYLELLGLALGLSLGEIGYDFHKLKSEKLEKFFSS